MRLFRFAFVAALLLGTLPAQAAMLWSESTDNGTPVLYWAKGANVNEIHAATRATIGKPYSVVLSCRRPGYFAFVGSPGQSQRGISCGYETPEGAVYEARQNCERESGRCDLEKVAYDDGKALASNADATGLPVALPGITDADDTAVPLGTNPIEE